MALPLRQRDLFRQRRRQARASHYRSRVCCMRTARQIQNPGCPPQAITSSRLVRIQAMRWPQVRLALQSVTADLDCREVLLRRLASNRQKRFMGIGTFSVPFRTPSPNASRFRLSFIPTRDGLDLATSFLLQDTMRSKSKGKRKADKADLDLGRGQSANSPRSPFDLTPR